MSAEAGHASRARERAASGDLVGALEAINLELGLRPDDMKLRVFRARILQSLGRIHAALEDIRHVDKGPVSFRFLLFRAELEEKGHQVEDTIKTLERALSIEPNAVVALAKCAVAYQSLGEFDRADALLQDALEVEPENGELNLLMAGLTRFEPGSKRLKELERRRLKQQSKSSAAYQMDFALARAYEQISDTDQAFRVLERANRGVRRAYPYDIGDRIRMVEAYMRVFDEFDPTDFQTADSSQLEPIFIAGMPRSGTTLVEQILSSHSEVEAGGETGLFFRLASARVGNPAAASFTGAKLTAENFVRIGQDYETSFRNLFNPGTRAVTDKSMQTIVYLGLVLAALPKARFVAVTRKPEATALSAYRHLFRPGKQLFSYDLSDIFAYQATYDAILNFWRERFPDRVTVLSYETLVSDPKNEIPLLLAQLGLPADHNCLTPEKNARPVMTFSFSEVRQPIHASSVDRWRVYESFLDGIARPEE